MKGYAKIVFNGEASQLPKNSRLRTGEGRLIALEQHLRKSGIDFVEDFDADNTVIVRWGAYIDDALFDREIKWPAVEEMAVCQ